MPIKAKKTEDDPVIVVNEIQVAHIRFNILGTSPLVPHAVSAKNKGALLFPPPKKTTAEKASTMKHEPFEEYVEAAYRFRDEDEVPTRLYMPGAAFHSAMAHAAIDMANAKKAQVARLTTITNEKVAVYGVPQIWSTIVRSSDMARTPDVRTLPIIPRWACSIEVEFAQPQLKEASIANLMGAAGKFQGIGDGRPQHGKLSMGRFRLCPDDDPEFMKIKREGTRKAQDLALQNPVYYDIETEQLLSWFLEEKKRRAAAPPRVAATKKKGGEEEATSVFVSPPPPKKSNGRRGRHAAT
jgi:hypothetical protein